MYVINDIQILEINSDEIHAPANPGFEMLVRYEDGVGRWPIVGWVYNNPVVEDASGLEVDNPPVIRHPSGCVFRSARDCWGSEAEWVAAEQAEIEAFSNSMRT